MGFYFELIIGLIATIGIIRFARTGSMGDAFNFGAILATMGKIGWINYILALIFMGIILRVVGGVLMAIPFIGGLIDFSCSRSLPCSRHDTCARSTTVQGQGQFFFF